MNIRITVADRPLPATPGRKKPHDARGATGIPDENSWGHFHTKGLAAFRLPARSGKIKKAGLRIDDPGVGARTARGRDLREKGSAPGFRRQPQRQSVPGAMREITGRFLRHKRLKPAPEGRDDVQIRLDPEPPGFRSAQASPQPPGDCQKTQRREPAIQGPIQMVLTSALLSGTIEFVRGPLARTLKRYAILTPAATVLDRAAGNRSANSSMRS